jgi:hypothetical protein
MKKNGVSAMASLSPPPAPSPPNGGGNGGRNGGDRPLFSSRAALFLLLALFMGFVIGSLTFAASANIPSAIIAGITTAGVVLYYGPKMIGE